MRCPPVPIACRSSPSGTACAQEGRELWFHLRFGAAIATGYPWLSFLCPGCQQFGEIDLRTLDRHPDETIESLILSLSYRGWRPNPPFVKLLGGFAAEGGLPLVSKSPAEFAAFPASETTRRAQAVKDTGAAAE